MPICVICQMDERLLRRSAAIASFSHDAACLRRPFESASQDLASVWKIVLVVAAYFPSGTGLLFPSGKLPLLREISAPRHAG
jgi:hypothetical protein